VVGRFGTSLEVISAAVQSTLAEFETRRLPEGAPSPAASGVSRGDGPALFGERLGRKVGELA
jgi:hypothetical protein